MLDAFNANGKRVLFLTGYNDNIIINPAEIFLK